MSGKLLLVVLAVGVVAMATGRMYDYCEWKLVSSSRANFAWSKKSGVDNVFCYFVANPEHVFNRQ